MEVVKRRFGQLEVWGCRHGSKCEDSRPKGDQSRTCSTFAYRKILPWIPPIGTDGILRFQRTCFIELGFGGSLHCDLDDMPKKPAAAVIIQQASLCAKQCAGLLFELGRESMTSMHAADSICWLRRSSQRLGMLGHVEAKQ